MVMKFSDLYQWEGIVVSLQHVPKHMLFCLFQRNEWWWWWQHTVHITLLIWI